MIFSVTLESQFRRYLRSGQPSDLAEVFDHVAPELLRMSRHLARDEAEAEDLVQGTFLIAIQKREQFDGKGQLTSWLVSIMVNELRQIRRRGRGGQELLTEGPAGSGDPVEQAHAAEVRTEVRAAVEGLPEPYREVLRRHLMGHEAAKEIGERLQRSGDTVRSQIRRGLEMLRRALPVGLATGVAVTMTPARGLAAVRENMLLGARAQPIVIGGALVWKSLAVACTLLLFVGGAITATMSWYGSERDFVASLAMDPVKVSDPAALQGQKGPSLFEGVGATAREKIEAGKVGAAPFSIRVRVKDKSGASVERALVVLRRDRADVSLLNWSELPLKFKRRYIQDHELQEKAGVSLALTDAEGRASFHPLSPGRFELHLHPPSLSQRQVGPVYSSCVTTYPEWKFVPGTRPPQVELTEAERAAEVEIGLKPESEAVIYVVGPDGNGLGNASVRLRLLAANYSNDSRTDAAGCCRLAGLVAGSYELSVHSIRSGLVKPLSQIIELVPGESKVIAPVVFERGSGRIVGRVIDQRGKPVEGLKVMAVRDDEAWNESLKARSNEEGEFVLKHMPCERLKIKVMDWKGYLDKLAAHTEPFFVDLGKGPSADVGDVKVLRNIPHTLTVDLTFAKKVYKGKELRISRGWLRCMAIPGIRTAAEIKATLPSDLFELREHFGSGFRLIEISRSETKPIVIETRSPCEPFTLFFYVPGRYGESCGVLMHHVYGEEGKSEWVNLVF